jgi:hypothetical protein
VNGVKTEPVPAPPIKPADLERRRRGRNWALFVVLFALAGLFYAITIAKMTRH